MYDITTVYPAHSVNNRTFYVFSVHRTQPTNELGEQQQHLQSECATSGQTETGPIRTRGQKLSAKRLGSVWRHAAGEQIEQVKKTITPENVLEESVMGKCESSHKLEFSCKANSDAIGVKLKLTLCLSSFHIQSH